MSFDTLSDFGQLFPGVLQEMRSHTMGFERSVVFVLLVDEKAAGLGFVPMHLVHGTTGFLAGVLSQFLKQSGDFSFMPNFGHPGNCQHHHRLAP